MVILWLLILCLLSFANDARAAPFAAVFAVLCWRAVDDASWSDVCLAQPPDALTQEHEPVPQTGLQRAAHCSPAEQPDLPLHQMNLDLMCQGPSCLNSNRICPLLTACRQSNSIFTSLLDDGPLRLLPQSQGVQAILPPGCQQPPVAASVSKHELRATRKCIGIQGNHGSVVLRWSSGRTCGRIVAFTVLNRTIYLFISVVFMSQITRSLGSLLIRAHDCACFCGGCLLMLYVVFLDE